MKPDVIKIRNAYNIEYKQFTFSDFSKFRKE